MGEGDRRVANEGPSEGNEGLKRAAQEMEGWARDQSEGADLALSCIRVVYSLQ